MELWAKTVADLTLAETTLHQSMPSELARMYEKKKLLAFKARLGSIGWPDDSHQGRVDTFSCAESVLHNVQRIECVEGSNQ